MIKKINLKNLVAGLAKATPQVETVQTENGGKMEEKMEEKKQKWRKNGGKWRKMEEMTKNGTNINFSGI